MIGPYRSSDRAARARVLGERKAELAREISVLERQIAHARKAYDAHQNSSQMAFDQPGSQNGGGASGQAREPMHWTRAMAIGFLVPFCIWLLSVPFAHD